MSGRMTLRAGLAAIWAMVLLLNGPLAFAHGGEDHGDAAAPTPVPGAKPLAATLGLANEELAAPQRLPDGRLWVPKSAQHRLGIRTVVVKSGPQPQTLELSGRVLADPNAGGRVQASQAGRIEAGPQGLPVLGQRVTKGQVLAYLRPVGSSLERGNQLSGLAELEGQLETAERRLARFEQLDGAIARKDIEAARQERDTLRARRAVVASSVQAPEALVAPVSGTVAVASVALGQVVDAKDILFELVDPSRLLVEALVHDPRQAQGLRQASALAPGGRVDLLPLGSAGQLREQALPVLFRVRGSAAAAGLVVGQSLPVLAQTAASQVGWVVPRSALVRNAAGEPVVWVHQAAEHFIARLVRAEPLDATNALITQGLHDGDRVVSESASLLAQLR